MLLSSLYTCLVIALVMVTYLLPPTIFQDRRFTPRVLKALAIVITTLIIAITIRFIIQRSLAVRDDEHMFNLLKAKHGSFRDFHTSIYLRLDVYLTLEAEVLRELARTGTLLAGLFYLLIAAIYFVGSLWSPSFPKIRIVDLFHLGFGIQLTMLAMDFSRLRGLWTPYLCLLSSMVVSPHWAFYPKQGGKVIRYILGFLILLWLLNGSNYFEVISNQVNNENGNPDQRPGVRIAMSWIRNNTPPDSVFAGDMISTSWVRLMTDRRIVLHPHYEDAQLRSKVYNVSHWAAFRRPSDVHSMLRSYGITHVIDSTNFCSTSRKGKTYADMVEEGENGLPPPQLKVTKIRCCERVRNGNSKYFQLIYTDHRQFWIYKLL
eukprot:NODE_3974_length_1251_cov_36.148050_g3486_i0.p1 GENE.NODE_3974_length_1251_cov_36.148050_g3486_i0~~NODE_3974_length_1251_cov_36.148050_g3486_i0.p1  ORF type:complete len:405 (+),score=60.59 NODE_3974_length_1251_cov_36.148050_g3486_i0:92-1216(+)